MSREPRLPRSMRPQAARPKKADGADKVANTTTVTRSAATGPSPARPTSLAAEKKAAVRAATTRKPAPQLAEAAPAVPPAPMPVPSAATERGAPVAPGGAPVLPTGTTGAVPEAPAEQMADAASPASEVLEAESQADPAEKNPVSAITALDDDDDDESRRRATAAQQAAVKAEEEEVLAALGVQPATADAVTAPAPVMQPRGLASISFEDNAALIRLPGWPEPEGVDLDDTPLARERWLVAEDETLCIVCPPPTFDGRSHTLAISFGADELPVEFTFRSEYRGYLEQATDEVIGGWLYDALRPTSELQLEVRGESFGEIAVATTIEREDLLQHGHFASKPGFDIKLPRRPLSARPELVTISVKGTTTQPLGPILRGTSAVAAVAAATAAARSIGHEATRLLVGGMLLPNLTRSILSGPSSGLRGVETGATAMRPHLGHSRLGEPRVDIIVPVYAGEEETMACIESVLASAGRITQRLIVVDDCGPEPELSRRLQQLGAAGRLTYLRNPGNLGFVASVNRGMLEADRNDVVLLNSDTVVPPGFVDRLFRAAYADQTIASSSPMSNNATILSLPEMNPEDADLATPPYGMALTKVDEVVARVNAGETRDLPTAHGFCMFIKRAALDEVGLFDEAAFGLGYGEENDWSLRAFERGWRNVAAADVYVEHKGAVSFSGRRAARVQAALERLAERYPYYDALIQDFLRTDPLHDLRNRVQKAVWKRHGPVALQISLGLEGGAARHADDMAARLSAEGFLALTFSAGRDVAGNRTLSIRRNGKREALHYPANVPLAAALADILDLAPQFIHVQHVLDLPDGVAEFVRDSGIPYAVTLHDFFYGCPRVTLLDEASTYCGMPPPSKCAPCVRRGGIHPYVHPSLVDFSRTGELWRGKWDGLLRRASQLIAPSRDTADRYVKLFPDLKVDVRPHFSARRERPHPVPVSREEKRLRVAVPGSIGPQKGSQALLDLVRHAARWDDDIAFVVVGHTDRDAAFAAYENVRITGPYPAEQAVPRLRQSRCRVALFLSAFPETFGYTLSESLEAGLTPVAVDFGALGERLRDYGTGALVAPDARPEQIVAAIRQAAAMEPVAVPHDGYAHYDRLIADYYAEALRKPVAAPAAPRLLGWPRGMFADKYCGAEATFHVWSPLPITRVALSFWAPRTMPMQAVSIECNGLPVAREFLEEGRTRRIVHILTGRDAHFVELRARFDYTMPIGQNVQRQVAGAFAGLEIGDRVGLHTVELPPWPGRTPARRDAEPARAAA